MGYGFPYHGRNMARMATFRRTRSMGGQIQKTSGSKPEVDANPLAVASEKMTGNTARWWALIRHRKGG